MLEKMRTEIARKFFEHGFGNTKVCYEVLQILDKYAKQEKDAYDKVLAYLKANVDDFPDYHEAIEAVLKMKGGE